MGYINRQIKNKVGKLDTMATIGLVIGMVVVALACVAIMTIALTVLNGIAVQYLWGLFVVPGLGVAALTLTQAMGIILLAGLLMSGLAIMLNSKTAEKEEKNPLFACLQVFLIPIFSMGFGWLVANFGPVLESWIS